MIAEHRRKAVYHIMTSYHIHVSIHVYEHVHLIAQTVVILELLYSLVSGVVGGGCRNEKEGAPRICVRTDPDTMYAYWYDRGLPPC